jgi:ethanolamine utilization protein EutN
VRLGRVVGRVVATVRARDLDGEKLLVVQPLDAARRPAGPAVVACDVAQSGLGDLVVWVGGREAALALRRTFVPVDATIVGHVEQAAEAPPPPPRDARGGK